MKGGISFPFLYTIFSFFSFFIFSGMVNISCAQNRLPWPQRALFFHPLSPSPSFLFSCDASRCAKDLSPPFQTKETSSPPRTLLLLPCLIRGNHLSSPRDPPRNWFPGFPSFLPYFLFLSMGLEPPPMML